MLLLDLLITQSSHRTATNLPSHHRLLLDGLLAALPAGTVQVLNWWQSRGWWKGRTHLPQAAVRDVENTLTEFKPSILPSFASTLMLLRRPEETFCFHEAAPCKHWCGSNSWLSANSTDEEPSFAFHGRLNKLRWHINNPAFFQSLNVAAMVPDRWSDIKPEVWICVRTHV